MGIEILSFTIKDVFDNVEYLSSLGKSQTANVRRDADVGVAQANRDAGIRVNNSKILYQYHTIKLYCNTDACNDIILFCRNQSVKSPRWMSSTLQTLK